MDGGNNFGRVPGLTGLMYDYTASLRSQLIAEIPAGHWIVFFKRHAEAKRPRRDLAHLTRDLKRSGLNREAEADVAEAISQIVNRLG